MSDSINEQRKLNPFEDARRNVGIAPLARLSGFAALVKAAFPTARVLLTGSARTCKEWRDLDVYLVLPCEQYDSLVTRGAHGLSTGWDAHAAAWSALAEQMVGQPVEARYMPSDSDWLDGTEISLLPEGTAL